MAMELSSADIMVALQNGKKINFLINCGNIATLYMISLIKKSFIKINQDSVERQSYIRHPWDGANERFSRIYQFSRETLRKWPSLTIEIAGKEEIITAAAPKQGTWKNGQLNKYHQTYFQDYLARSNAD